MGDELCGPSNPLQNFRKQTSADRTLQQDRIAPQRTPQESFRSPPGPSAGTLDPEFEAFQAGLPPPPQEQLPFHPPPQTLAGPSGLSGWEADFQRLHLSSPPPPQLHAQTPLQHNRQAAPKIAGNSPWHQDFMQQAFPIQQPNGSFASPPYSSYSQVRPQGNSMTNFGSLQNHEPFQQGHSHELFDDAAFTQAFNAFGEHGMEEGSQESSNHLAAEEEVERLRDAEATRKATRERYGRMTAKRAQRIKDAAETRNAAAELHGRFEAKRVLQEAGIPVTADGLPSFDFGEPQVRHEEPEQRQDHPLQQEQEDKQEHDEADDLAATARQLLNSVADNQSAKFENSEFLGLMRKLRDKEVRVEGDKMVEVNKVSEPQGELPDIGQLLRKADKVMGPVKPNWLQDSIHRARSYDLPPGLLDDFLTTLPSLEREMKATSM
ncbi:MAG: hypothetical protein M1821_007031 [Bathelium mastoideum]|nr:MAG: hypothetical protein M1821_007031 [Bathelium mastoideum]